MHFTKLSFDDYMNRVAVLIGNSLSNTKIVEATGRFGYDETRLKEGEQLYRMVIEVSKEQNVAIQSKVKAHNERKQLYVLVKKKYMNILQIARIAFDKDVIISKALQLDGPRETNLDAWMNQVALFGNRILSEDRWINMLKKFGIGKTDIIGLLSDLDKLRSFALLCEQSKSSSKKQTAVKKQKLKELQQWVSDYLKIAKIALEEEPDLYYKLKI